MSAKNEKQFESCRITGNGDCINEMLAGISGASGYRELGIQIGFDIAGQYQQMGKMPLTDLIPVDGQLVRGAD
ncbi:hypothetical protein LNO92_13060 [Klebsiella variicola subsp. variicola]|nr:hypothetical protein [Klebsiella variicola subsp. variicola]